jgi:DHA2 family multidrug resistance protein
MPKAITGDITTLRQLDQLVNQQAAMISYVNDFKLMMVVTLCAIPLVFLLRRPTASRPAVAAAHMD